MKEFTTRHFFGPQGEVHLISRKNFIHSDFIHDNPELFGFRDKKHVETIEQSGRSIWDPVMQRGFIRGEYGFDGKTKTHIHNLSYEGRKGATALKFKKALETLHHHYSKHPNRKFSIGLFAFDADEDNSLYNRVYKIVGGDEIDENMHTLDHLHQFISSIREKPTAPIIKKITRTDAVPVVDTSRLGQEPNMGQGNMTTAEWNFWRRKGLGDSYTPIMTFKQYITEGRADIKNFRGI